MLRNTDTETYFGKSTQSGVQMARFDYYDSEDNSLGYIKYPAPPSYVDNKTLDRQTITLSGKKAAAKIVAELYVNNGSTAKTYTATVYKTPNNE